MTDSNPVHIKSYRTPESQKDDISRQIDKMLVDKIIEPSVLPYSKIWPNDPVTPWKEIHKVKLGNRRQVQTPLYSTRRAYQMESHFT